jgi:hypothetical protein
MMHSLGQPTHSTSFYNQQRRRINLRLWASRDEVTSVFSNADYSVTTNRLRFVDGV